MNKKSLIIWGTGAVANKFVNVFQKYKKEYAKFGGNYYEIMGFIDSNPAKCSSEYFGYTVKAPQEYPLKNLAGRLIIAIKDDKDIIASLVAKGMVENQDFYSYRHFIKNNLIAKGFLCDVLQKAHYCDNNTSTGETGEFEEMWNTFENRLPLFINNLYDIFEKTKKLYNNDASLVSYLKEKCSVLIVLFYQDMDISEHFERLCNYWGVGNIVSALEFVYDDAIEVLQKRLHIEDFPLKNQGIHVIGVYYPRFFSGGVERVLSLLFPMWIHSGYEVVLITNFINPSDEYRIPPAVTRVCLPERTQSDIYFGYTALEHYLKEYHVDLLFIHACYGMECYYQIMVARFLGLYTMGELHTNFSFFLESKKPLSFYINMYKHFHQLIVLSKTDMKFWRLWGVHCKYIPNPVINPKRDVVNKEFSLAILWIGRIDQVQKRIFDIIPIMKRVVEKIPTARLKIVGQADRPDIYAALKEKIRKTSLENHVEFCGYHVDVSRFYEEAAVMFMTSQSMEGFPMVLAESKTYGVPVVMFDMPYLELLRNPTGCITVPVGDVSAIADQLIAILSDKGLWKRLSKEACESIQDFLHYDYEKEWDETFKTISDHDVKRIALTEDEQDYKNIVQWLIAHEGC